MADFRLFFEQIEPELLESVEAVAMDMNAPYHIVVGEMMPGMEVVYDRYHMEAQFGKDVMGAVRLEGLVSHATHAIGTERLEGTNNKIKILKRIACGFRDEEYFFSLVRFITIPDSRKVL